MLGGTVDPTTRAIARAKIIKSTSKTLLKKAGDY
jgi:hypothetical protein